MIDSTMVVLAPMHNFLNSMNNENFYSQYHQKNRFYRAVIKSNNFTYFYILKFLHESCFLPWKSKKVLDVGCGVGSISMYLADQGASVVGLDISSRAIQIAQVAKRKLKLDRIRFIEGELGHGESKFDVVISLEVIEHIADDDMFADQLYSQLKPGGYLLLSTPLNENWLYKQGFYDSFDSQVGHLRRYRVETILDLLTKSGFIIEKHVEVEGPLRNLLYTTKLGFFVRFIRGPFVSWYHWIDNQFGKLMGWSDVIIIARKPKLIA